MGLKQATMRDRQLYGGGMWRDAPRGATERLLEAEVRTCYGGPRSVYRLCRRGDSISIYTSPLDCGTES